MTNNLSIVVPVYNEEKSIPRLLESLANLSSLDFISSIILVDGMSSDRSKEIIHFWMDRLPQLVLLDNPQMKTPCAFNIGIKYSLQQGADAILLLSAHSWVKSDFIEVLADALDNSVADIIGSVHFYPKPKNRIEEAIQVFSESWLGRRLNYYTYMKDITPTNLAFCPTIQKIVFEKIGFFDEKLDRNQDNDFTKRALANGLKIVTHPGLRYGYLTRDSISGFTTQMYNNGYWIGKSLKIFNLKYFLPIIFYLGIAASILIWFFYNNNIFLILLLAPYLLFTLVESINQWIKNKKILIFLPFIFLINHFSYAIGTLVGIINSLDQQVSKI